MSLVEEVRETLRPNLCDADGKWTADYVRLRFAATKASDGEPLTTAHTDDANHFLNIQTSLTLK